MACNFLRDPVINKWQFFYRLINHICCVIIFSNQRTHLNICNLKKNNLIMFYINKQYANNENAYFNIKKLKFKHFHSLTKHINIIQKHENHNNNKKYHNNIYKRMQITITSLKRSFSRHTKILNCFIHKKKKHYHYKNKIIILLYIQKIQHISLKY